jgi:hypothetical protein
LRISDEVIPSVTHVREQRLELLAYEAVGYLFDGIANLSMRK